MSGAARYDMRQWENFWKRWGKLADAWPDAKRTALSEAGKAALKEVLSQINQRVTDPRGRVHRWQDMKLGSRGGYVAVTANDEETVQLTKAGKKTTSRDVTRYLERGHAARGPSGRDKRYSERISSSRLIVGESRFVIQGRQFYSWAKLHAGDLGREAAEEALGQLKAAIEQGGMRLD